MADIRSGNHRAFDGEQLLLESLQHIAARQKK